jgi:hypothetical protein
VAFKGCRVISKTPSTRLYLRTRTHTSIPTIEFIFVLIIEFLFCLKFRGRQSIFKVLSPNTTTFHGRPAPPPCPLAPPPLPTPIGDPRAVYCYCLPFQTPSGGGAPSFSQNPGNLAQLTSLLYPVSRPRFLARDVVITATHVILFHYQTCNHTEPYCG